jgi:hypothetical protein
MSCRDVAVSENTRTGWNCQCVCCGNFFSYNECRLFGEHYRRLHFFKEAQFSMYYIILGCPGLPFYDLWVGLVSGFMQDYLATVTGYHFQTAEMRIL